MPSPACRLPGMAGQDQHLRRPAEADHRGATDRRGADQAGEGPRPSQVIARAWRTQPQDCRIEGLIHAVVQSKTIIVRDSDVDLLSLCWCCNHDADGSQPFLLTLPPETIDFAMHRYGSLFSPDLTSLATKAADAFGLDDPELFENSPLAQFGPPASTEWFSLVERAADHVLQERLQAEDLHQQRMRADAAEVEREIANIESECSHLEKLVAKYGSKLPATYLAHLPKFPQPPAGPLTNAIVLSWVSAEGHWPQVDFKDHRHWPIGLRLLDWVFSGQQAAVWDSLERAGPTGRAVALRIQQFVSNAQDELANHPRIGLGGATGAGIWVSIGP
jgi:hypothetical protein